MKRMKIMWKLCKAFLNSKFRTSKYFRAIENLTNYSEKEKMIKNCIDFLKENKIEGDYLEFGVYQGSNFIKVYNFVRGSSLKNMSFYLFDSFEGLPKIKGLDKGGIFQEGEYSYDFESFKKLLFKKGVDLKNVYITKGWFDKVLDDKLKKKLNLKKASLIFIDCDLYKSTAPVLDFITDYIQDGTIIIFDDYFCFKGNRLKGERRAFEEWLKKSPHLEATEFYKYSWSGNSFILNKISS